MHRDLTLTIYLSKKKIIKAILMALTVLLTAAQSTDGKEEPAKFNDAPDTYSK